MLGQGGVNVSGGQKQRLCIARAMLKKPRILILDDSTSAVDSATEAKIRESFYHNLADTTVFIIAQRISSVRDADKIIVLDDGKIVGIGTHQELLAEQRDLPGDQRFAAGRSVDQWMRDASKANAQMHPPGPRAGRACRWRLRNAPKTRARPCCACSATCSNKKLTLVVVIVLMLLSTFSMLAGNYFLKPLINDYILPGDFDGLAARLADPGGHLPGRRRLRPTCRAA